MTPLQFLALAFGLGLGMAAGVGAAFLWIARSAGGF